MQGVHNCTQGEAQINELNIVEHVYCHPLQENNFTATHKAAEL